MDTVAHNKLITCIIPRGMGNNLVESLHADKGMITTNVSSGRGVSKREDFFSEEVDILTVVVDQAQADDVFEYLYDRIDVDQTKGRFMFQQALGLTSDFCMPDDIQTEEE